MEGLRDAVDVVVPVAAGADELRAVLGRMRGLRLRPGDTLTVVDNRGVGVDDDSVFVATAVRTSYHARNAGAARGSAPWIAFLDADVRAPADLLDRLLEPAPAPGTAVVGGGVTDVAAADAGYSAAVRFAELKSSMSQDVTLGHDGWAFVQTANAMVRREAFEAIGGFRETVRSGGDADLCWRLRAAGWQLETRAGASVVHDNRATVRDMLGQRFRHGTGAGWLSREHAGALPRRHWPGLIWWGTRRAASGVRCLAKGDRDGAVLGLLDGPAVWAFELGRLVPNRPLPVRRQRR